MARSNCPLTLGLAFGAVFLASMYGTPAQADEKEKELNRNPVNCVNINMIDRKTAIDNKTILLSMKGNKFYRVDLPGACPVLTPGENQLIFINVNKSGGKMARLCNTDSFGVQNRPGTGGCQLAKFNPITGEEAAELTAKTK